MCIYTYTHNIYACIHICKHTYVYMHTHIDTYIHTHIHTHTHTQTHIRTHTNTHTHTHTRTFPTPTHLNRDARNKKLQVRRHERTFAKTKLRGSLIGMPKQKRSCRRHGRQMNESYHIVLQCVAVCCSVGKCKQKRPHTSHGRYINESYHTHDT